MADSTCIHAATHTEDLGDGRMRIICTGCGAVLYSD